MPLVLRTLGSFVALAMVTSACGGGSSVLTPRGVVATSAPTTAPSTTAPVPGTAIVQGRLALPAGVNVAVTTLKVSDSVGSVSPNSDGTFALATFTSGPQFTTVSDRTGAPILFGFYGPGATTIDTASTAQVLVYFSAAFYTLPMPYRSEIVDQVGNAPGFATLESAIDAALAKNVDSLGSSQTAAPVTSALSGFVASLYAPTNSSTAAMMLRANAPSRQSILINPSNGMSGTTLINDFPNGIHFQNTYRRQAEAFIDECSYVDASGTEISKPVVDSVAPVPISAVSGIGNVTGTLIGTVQNLFSGATAYTPIETDDVPLALEPGSSRTRYRVTVVGPGVRPPGGIAPAPPTCPALTGGVTVGTTMLSREQVTAEGQLAAQQLVEDYLVPIVTSFVIPIKSSQIDSFFKFDGGNAAVSDLISDVASVRGIVSLMNAGQVNDALVTAVNAIASGGVLQAATLQVVQDVVSNSAGSSAAAAAVANGTSLLTILNIVGGVTTSIDLSAVTTNIVSSDIADVYVVDVTADKATLTPATASIVPLATQQFTVNVPSASGSGETLAYAWTNTAANGTLTDGIAGHLNNFNSSSNVVTYTGKSNGSGADTIGVTAYLVKGQQRVQLGDPAMSTVTVTAASLDAVWPAGTTNGAGYYSPSDGGSLILQNGSIKDDELQLTSPIYSCDGVVCPGPATEQVHQTFSFPKAAIVSFYGTNDATTNTYGLAIVCSTGQSQACSATQTTTETFPPQGSTATPSPCASNCTYTFEGGATVELPDPATQQSLLTQLEDTLGFPPSQAVNDSNRRHTFARNVGR